MTMLGITPEDACAMLVWYSCFICTAKPLMWIVRGDIGGVEALLCLTLAVAAAMFTEFYFREGRDECLASQ